MEAEPVVAASVARRAGRVVCEEALAAAFEGGGRKARSVVGNLDDEVSARDVAGDRHARARVLGGVGSRFAAARARAVRSPEVGPAISELKPTPLLPTRSAMILSRPTKAPPQMNRMLVVSMDEKSVRKSHGHHIPPAKGMGE